MTSIGQFPMQRLTPKNRLCTYNQKTTAIAPSHHTIDVSSIEKHEGWLIFPFVQHAPTLQLLLACP